MVLDGAMIVIATTTLTFMHPGIGFDGRWVDASFPFRIVKKGAQNEAVLLTGSNIREEVEDRESSGVKLG
jgi:hypothetical protein